MNGHSTTEYDLSPKMNKYGSLSASQPIKLLRENSGVVQAELQLPRVESEEPLFTKVSVFKPDVQEK
jgi:hypothetical protein